jgi:hypothetical protein
MLYKKVNEISFYAKGFMEVENENGVSEGGG